MRSSSKSPAPDQIDSAIELIPDDYFPFFEFPADIATNGDCRGFVAALAGHGAAAKIRTRRRHRRRRSPLRARSPTS